MRPERLQWHFERIADATDAVPRLRQFILDLAVRGKLTEQDLADEPADELMRRIEAEKAVLSKAGSIRKPKPLPDVEEDEFPYSVPPNWSWSRLGSLSLRIHYGYTASATKNVKGVRLLRITDIQNNRVDWSSVPGCEISDEQAAQYLLVDGDILIARTGGTIGKSFLVKGIPVKAVFASYLIRVQGSQEILDRFLKLCLESPVYWSQLEAGARGAGQPNVNGRTLGGMALPLPPLAEQHRIVAKVDELMALCGELEAAQAKRESRRDRLVAATLHGLNNGDTTPKDQRHAARFYFNHLPRLTTRPEHIRQLRHTILNLAVRGRLAARSTWPKQAQPLGKFAKLQNGYAFKSGWFVQSGVRLLRNANVSHGVIRWNNLACLPQGRATEFERFQLSENDVVLSLDRPLIATGIKVARVRSQDLPCLLLQRVGRFCPKLEHLSPDYLFLWLQSPHFTDQIDPGRSNGVPHISSKQVEATKIFVPPLAEQHRIVAKVDELTALCDDLETRLTDAADTRHALLQATLSEALAST